MNWLVTHCDSTMVDCAVLFLRSLAKCSKARVAFFGYGLTDSQIDALGTANPNVGYHVLREKDFAGRIATSKVECVAEATDTVAEDDDLIIASDVDMLVKRDPFDLFKEEGDVFVTRRPGKWKHPINGGLWGFRMNDAGYRFIDFYRDQVHSKDWLPYRAYLKGFGHLQETNWRVGQDFLNVVALAQLPFPCKVTVLGPEWNWVHDSGAKKKVDPRRQAEQDALFEKAKNAYAHAMADPTIHVVHFKARMKYEMARYAQ